jgi:glycosyltransferase involved in cell wall biosynthesis
MSEQLSLVENGSMNSEVRFFSGAASHDGKQCELHVIVFGPGSQDLRFEGLFATEPVSALLTGGVAGINRKLYAIAADQPESLVLFVPAAVGCSAADVIALADVLAADPLYGFAQPLVAGAGSLDATSRMAAHLPVHERRIPMGAPVLVRASILRDFGLLDEASVNLDSALAQLFIRANRRGVSARRANRVILQADASWTGEEALQLNRAGDYTRAQVAQMNLPESRFERLLKHRFSARPEREVLFDIRNLAPGFNGTAHHILALLGPLHRMARERGIRPYFWVLPASAEFHGLNALYPDAVIHELQADQCFDASIRLTQPWSLTEVRDQAYVSTVNLVSVLDTIAWDCHYIRMPHLEGVWRAMAEYSDGFVFNSAYTGARFLARFPQAASADHAVAHCSMVPAEYWSAQERAQAQDGDHEQPYVLIVGNRYYHKGLTEVVRPLSSAFPELKFKVLGEFQGQFHNVEQIASGAQTSADVARLFAGSTCLVFPSFYEGFGLPIFEALAFGKPVLARDSELIQELQGHLQPLHGLRSFSSHNELFRGLKTLLTGSSPEVHAQEAVPQAPYGWEASARDILDLIERRLQAVNFERCRQRLEFFYRLEMFDVERAGWANSAQNMVSFEVEKEE